MNVRIASKPDNLDDLRDNSLGYAGPKWLQGLADKIEPYLAVPPELLTIEMTDIAFTNLFEWVTFVSMLETLLANPSTREVGIDFVSHPRLKLLTPEECLDFRKRGFSKGHRRLDFEYSERVFKFAGFLDSLGTLDVLRKSHRGRVLFSFLGPKWAQFKSWYTAKEPSDAATVILGLTRIESKDDCKLFLDDHQILNWKGQMSERFAKSPLFEFEEVWRVFCHELAVNIWEHAGQAGFLCGRVVHPYNTKGEVQPWCSRSFAPTTQALFPKMSNGFLELCIADYGLGFIETLRDAYLRHTNQREKAKVDSTDLLCFAFDEFGTCKNANESWATERHALGRILLLIAKYGGTLTLRSGGAQVTYVGQGDRFQRFPNHLGYRPQSTAASTLRRGAQLQLVLPLVPIIETHKLIKRQSVFMATLPRSFRIDEQHVRGHLVPLLELLDFPNTCAGGEEQLLFRRACERLCKKLMKERPSGESLVLDFSGLHWEPAQFETLLHLLQNLLQTRPVLLVEIEPKLAKAANMLEQGGAASFLQMDDTVSAPSKTGRTYGEASETRYLETYRSIHCTVLALDQNGERHLFGIPTDDCEEALLSLIDEPRTIEEILKTHNVPESLIRAILNNTTQLFEHTLRGWRCIWDEESLAKQATRALTRHFDKIADLSLAWHGKSSGDLSHRQETKPEMSTRKLQLALGQEEDNARFNLPWQEGDEWVEQFFECSRILSRGRYADEAAQALIYRLRKWLESQNKALRDVGTLACGTAPATLLASAMHRWWPIEEGCSRPTIVDLGYYVMLHPDQTPPSISGAGGVVVVQDVLSHGVMSNQLIKLLKHQGANVLCLIALVHLKDQQSETSATSLLDWHTERVTGVPRHAMIAMPRPKSCKPPSNKDEYARSYWIEPRTLRPFSYRSLRGERPNTDQHKLMLSGSRVFEQHDSCLLSAGHYVYGTRHYPLAINMQEALRGPLGSELALWIADVCEGVPDRRVAPWETQKGSSLEGDVTAVLMPLHSQVHYLWPKVENILAQRGRRQPMWILDATLFLGRGPAYRLPLSFLRQLEYAVRESRNTKLPVDRQLRILILDEAIATGRTALTILDTIERHLKDLFNRHGVDFANGSPVQWIRYFAAFNGLSFAQDRHWHALNLIGDDLPIHFVFDEYIHCMGLSVYDDEACPACHELERIQGLLTTSDSILSAESLRWAKARKHQLRPIAVDNLSFRVRSSNKLRIPIQILPDYSLPVEIAPQYIAHYVDTAIGLFYELMYRSYPLNDIFQQIQISFGHSNNNSEHELSRYRFAVYEWSVRNWPRLVATGAREAFLQCIKFELDHSTGLIETLFQSLAQVRDDRRVLNFVLAAVNILTELDATHSRDQHVLDPQRVTKLTRLNTAIDLFLASGKRERDSADKLSEKNRAVEAILDALVFGAEEVGSDNLGFVKQLYVRHCRPSQLIDAKWPLYVIAESLFRGETAETRGLSEHRLLRRHLRDVIKNPSNPLYRSLLESGLQTFLAALNDLTPYAVLDLLDGDIIKHATVTLQWLAESLPTEAWDVAPAELRHLSDDLDPTRPFCENFNKVFHQEIEELRSYFIERVQDMEKHCSEKGMESSLIFEFSPDEEIKTSRVLTHVERLCLALANWTIDPHIKYTGAHKSSIIVKKARSRNGGECAIFRLLTDYDSPSASQANVIHGRSWEATRILLAQFGAVINKWTLPSAIEQERGYQAACDVQVPIGFSGKV